MLCPSAQVAGFPLQQTQTTVGEFANKISALRAKLSGKDDDVGIIAADGTPRLVTRDSNGIAYSRTPQVMACICYTLSPDERRTYLPVLTTTF